MLQETLLGVANSNGVTTPEWSISVAIIMITCNLFVIAIGKWAIKNPGAGPILPVALPGIWEKFGIPELLATTSLGHLLGAGMILGLANAGLL